MTLTVERAPFSPKASGCFNFESDRAHEVLFWDSVPHRVRAILAGRTVDSRSVVLLHETGRLPVYYFRAADVRCELLERSSRTSQCPHKGSARYWNVRVEDRFAPNAIWEYPEPIDSASFLAGNLALDWHSFDEWFVEHVRSELLVPSSTRSRCAYKESASYWHVRLRERLVEDLAWSYPDPQHDAEPVRDLPCFFNERVDIELDGEATDRPITRIIDRGRESGLVE